LIGTLRTGTRRVSEEERRFLADASGYDDPLLVFCSVTIKPPPHKGVKFILRFSHGWQSQSTDEDQIEKEIRALALPSVRKTEPGRSKR